MDAVRFGRALGVGARQAAKTVVTAVDAAMAESPSGKGTGPAMAGARPAVAARASAPTAPVRSSGVSSNASRTATRSVVQGHVARKGLREGRKRFREATWKPFVRLSGVLWLEVMGVFFGLFALFALGAVWRLRAQWHTGGAAHTQLLWSVLMLAVFGYFCLSSFVRAKRRERRR